MKLESVISRLTGIPHGGSAAFVRRLGEFLFSLKKSGAAAKASGKGALLRDLPSETDVPAQSRPEGGILLPFEEIQVPGKGIQTVMEGGGLGQAVTAASDFMKAAITTLGSGLPSTAKQQPEAAQTPLTEASLSRAPLNSGADTAHGWGTAVGKELYALLHDEEIPGRALVGNAGFGDLSSLVRDVITASASGQVFRAPLKQEMLAGGMAGRANGTEEYPVNMEVHYSMSVTGTDAAESSAGLTHASFTESLAAFNTGVKR